MWRHVKRGLQQRLRKKPSFEKHESCLKKEGDINTFHTEKKCKLLNVHKLLCLPTHYQNLNGCIIKNDNNKKNKKDNYEETTGNVGQHTFLEAFGWSGALVFGWAISKQLWLSCKWTRDEENQRYVYDRNIIQLLSQVVKTQPPVTYVLPNLQSITRTTSQTSLQGEGASDADTEFDKAAKDLLLAHEKAIGEALNRRGIACLSKSTGSEAIKLFLQASELKYPPASFNVGQCYELGIGTKQDFEQAATWYKIASEQGHATAMYNLGVFYAHGWGGLQADIGCAKKLFLKAAKLGQPDAVAALDRECKFKNISDCNANHSASSTEITSSSTHKTSSNIFVNNIRNGLADDVNLFQKGFSSDCSWNFSINSTIAF